MKTLVLNCFNNQESQFEILFESFLLPMLVAFTVFVASFKIKEWQERRKYSKLGVIIINELLEEVNNGLRSLINTSITDDNFRIGGNLPNKSWSGLNTIPIDVLLRIIECSKRENENHWHPSHIRSHCKNYFEHMSINWHKAIENYPRVKAIKSIKEMHPTYLEATKEVKALLEKIRILLSDNSKRIIPK